MIYLLWISIYLNLCAVYVIFAIEYSDKDYCFDWIFIPGVFLFSICADSIAWFHDKILDWRGK